MSDRDKPDRYKKIKNEYPNIFTHYEQVGELLNSSNILESKLITLIKLGMAIGAGYEGATHTHTRKALDKGFTKEEIRFAALTGITTLGFPHMMMGLSWIDDILDGK